MLDVVISGSGPAGAYASYLCAKAGLDVVLLERCEIPRAKCCAGGIMERALKLLDFEIPQDVIEQELSGFHVHLASHRYECKAPARLGVSVRRERFDQFMTKCRAHSEYYALVNRGGEGQGRIHHILRYVGIAFLGPSGRSEQP
jgi:flavin-dependent dehydrogenase